MEPYKELVRHLRGQSLQLISAIDLKILNGVWVGGKLRLLDWLTHEDILEDFEHEANFLVQGTCWESHSKLKNSFPNERILGFLLAPCAVLVGENSYFKIELYQTFTPRLKVIFDTYSFMVLAAINKVCKIWMNGTYISLKLGTMSWAPLHVSFQCRLNNGKVCVYSQHCHGCFRVGLG